MSLVNYKVFIIKNSKNNQPEYCFISKNYDEAILTFKDRLKIRNEEGIYKLYQFHNYNEILISQEYYTNKIRETIKEYKEKLEKASKEKEITKQIEILFDARRITSDNKKRVSRIY